jgi:hypothetical protein
MSKSRQALPNDFAPKPGWHDLVAIATSPAIRTRSSRDRDNVSAPKIRREIIEQSMSQLRHQIAPANPPDDGHGADFRSRARTRWRG